MAVRDAPASGVSAAASPTAHSKSKSSESTVATTETAAEGFTFSTRSTRPKVTAGTLPGRAVARRTAVDDRPSAVDTAREYEKSPASGANAT